ncbi:Vacuolar cation/proton exchanger 3 [Platanthera guangdongensis]|uniref:Vacuolar cation/proton exchanger 3 n=1 Tax=Platanthera guangdongensis TaxID=2320717 RepID=A0ABR2N4G7_9ASPA
MPTPPLSLFCFYPTLRHWPIENPFGPAMASTTYDAVEASYVVLLKEGGGRGLSKEVGLLQGRKPHMTSSMSLRTKSALSLSSRVSSSFLRNVFINLQEVFGTKLALLFPAVPLAVAAQFYGFGHCGDVIDAC